MPQSAAPKNRPDGTSRPLVLGALAIVTISCTLAVAANTFRPRPLLWRAPFPYDHDCPEKLVKMAVVTAAAYAPLHGRPNVALLDAREASHFQTAHIAGAASMPYSFFQPPSGPAVESLRKKFRAVFVYCDTEQQGISERLASQLKKAGLPHVKVVTGGFAQLKAAGLPITRR